MVYKNSLFICKKKFVSFDVACKVANRRIENADTESIEFTELPRL